MLLRVDCGWLIFKIYSVSGARCSLCVVKVVVVRWSLVVGCWLLFDVWCFGVLVFVVCVFGVSVFGV